MKKYINIILIIYWVILLGATSYPTADIPTMGIGDKGMHFAAYFILGVLLNFTLLYQNKYLLLKRMNSLFTMIIGISYAVFDEIHQHFIPGRSMEFLDFVADFFGLLLAVSLILILKRVGNLTFQNK